MKKKRVVVMTGAGISAESGIPTYRDSDGLWENHDVTEVASPEGWAKDQELVLRFYNERRRQMLEAQPNAGHVGLVELEKGYDVCIITQNIDDLHERAGSRRVLHLHGEIGKARSTQNPNLVYDLEGADINVGDVCSEGSQLRPHIVWFGEDVPEIMRAAQLTAIAELVIIVGTSLLVYPANQLIDYAPENAPVYLVDPKEPGISLSREINFIQEKASVGIPKLVKMLMETV